MKRIKTYLIIGAIIIIASAFVTANRLIKVNKELKAEIARVQSNNIQLMGENMRVVTLRLKQKELTGKALAERDSALKRLELRPKEIIKIVTNTIIQHDTIRERVYVTQSGQDRWSIADTGKCFIYNADVYLKNKIDLEVWRSAFEYKNDIKEVFYKERPHKFLFIRFGRWDYKRDVSSTCGTSSVEEIEFIK